MIDLFIATGRLGPVEPHHQTCLSIVTYSRFSASKTTPTSTYINSPITCVQMELQYKVADVAGIPNAFVGIKIPLASATVGHNYMHAGLDSIDLELVCAKLLCKVVLTVLAFKPEEIERFFRETKVELVELTWHSPTASPKALRCVQKRTKDVFDGLRLASSRHDVAVSDVQYWESNGSPGLLVTLKDGNHFRQYGKIDQIASRAKRDRKPSQMSPEARLYLPKIRDAIKHHARNELLLTAETLKADGLSHPNNWTAESLKALIDSVWEKAGLGQRAEAPDATKLSPEAAATLERYQAGEHPRDFLPPHTLSRHRSSILDATDTEIDRRPNQSKANRRSVGYQLQYDRRWEPKGDLRKLVLCEVTAPAIIEELKRGLAFLESGETPEFVTEEERSCWQMRWTTFAEREGGPRHPAGCKQLDQPSCLPDTPATPGIPMSRGIGSVPVEPGIKDEVTWFEGEWRVI